MKRLILLCGIILLCFSVNTAYSYWIWTPKTGKWTNPKNAVKPAPKEQFDYAKSFYDQKKYEDAIREFKKLLKSYPKSFEASESQYYLGVIEEERDNLYDAYKAYQKVVDKYPFSERIQDIIDREFKIAEKFMGGYKQKTMGVALPVAENPAIEIFSKVVENSTYGPKAPAAQYKLGLVLKSTLRYYEAEEAFNKIISNYPDSEWSGPAKFQIAECRSAVSRGPAYDQGAAKEAQEKYEAFIREHPEAGLSREAETNIKKLKEEEAEGNFNIGIFYEKQKAYGSAKIYYEDIITKFPDSPWAQKAQERLELLEKKK